MKFFLLKYFLNCSVVKWYAQASLKRRFAGSIPARAAKMNPTQFNSTNIRNNLNQIREFLITKVTKGINKFKIISFKTNNNFEFLFELNETTEQIKVNKEFEISDVDNAMLLIALEIIEKLEANEASFPPKIS